MTDFVQVYQCDPDGTNCTGPYLVEGTEVGPSVWPVWLDVNHEFYQYFFETTSLMLVVAIVVRLVGKVAFYSS